jgi:hypothetical protein
VPGNIATYKLGPFAAGNAANIVASNTPAGAGNLAIIGGTFVADAPRRVGVTLGAEASPRTVKITGTNVYGAPINETLICAAASVTATVQDFATVTAVQVFAAFTAAMTVGTTVAAGTAGHPIGSTPWFAVEFFGITTNVSVGVSRLDSSAALTTGYMLEGTFDDINAAYEPPGVLAPPSSTNPQSNIPPVVFGDAATLGAFGSQPGALKTGAAVGFIQQPFWSVRVALYDATPAQLNVQFMQAMHY